MKIKFCLFIISLHSYTTINHNIVGATTTTQLNDEIYFADINNSNDDESNEVTKDEVMAQIQPNEEGIETNMEPFHGSDIAGKIEKALKYDEDLNKWFRNTLAGKNEAIQEDVVQTVWGLHRRWSTISRKRRRAFKFHQGLAVVLVSSGAILQTLSNQLPAPYEWITSLGAGGCLGLAPFVTQHFLSHEKMTAWVESRAASEGLKAEVFKFRAGVKPYHTDNSVEILATKASEILEPAQEFDSYNKLDTESILWKANQSATKEDKDQTSPSASPSMGTDDVVFVGCRDFSRHKMKPPPGLKLGEASHIEWRLKPQVECFYRNGGGKLRNQVFRIKILQNFLAASSSGIAFVAARRRLLESGKEGPLSWLGTKLNGIGLWGPVLTTITSAIGTNIAVSKLEQLASEWRDAANNIERKVLIMTSKGWQPGTPEWESFVLGCEKIIASTTQSWSKAIEREDKDIVISINESSRASMKSMKKWNSDAMCTDEFSGSHSAEQRKQWLMKYKQHTEKQAKEMIMEEFPDMFNA